MRTFEDLLSDLGGMGKFQVALVVLVNSNQLFAGWSMLLMSFAGLVPDYHCLSDNITDSVSNQTLNVCDVNGTSCSRYQFQSHDVTVVTEWNLLCDQKWAKQFLTSGQMVGVLIGCLAAGQISDTFGRKVSLFGFNLYHIVVNFIAAFSVSWYMFAVMRFLIGIGIGGVLVVAFNFSVEFLPIRWRSLQTVLPTWALGVSLFALAAYILDNWSHLHLACAILSIPSLLGWFFVPESVRWLTLKEQLDSAHQVIEKIARVNGKEVPADVSKILQDVVDKERLSRESEKIYNYTDLFRSRKMIWIDAVVWYFWFSVSLCYYGIAFGVSSLSGNIYLNIVLLSVLELPVRFSSFYFINKFGRKWTTMTFFLFSFLPLVGCLVSEMAASDDNRGSLINIFCLIAKMMLGSAWSGVQMWTSELYPTVVRNLGLGFASFGEIIGGILAPFLIDMDELATEAWVTMSIVTFLGTLVCFTLEETNGEELKDSFNNNRKDKK